MHYCLSARLRTLERVKLLCAISAQIILYTAQESWGVPPGPLASLACCAMLCCTSPGCGLLCPGMRKQRLGMPWGSFGCMMAEKALRTAPMCDHYLDTCAGFGSSWHLAKVEVINLTTGERVRTHRLIGSPLSLACCCCCCCCCCC